MKQIQHMRIFSIICQDLVEPIERTTRRVSASKFLGRDDLATNSKIKRKKNNNIKKYNSSTED